MSSAPAADARAEHRRLLAARRDLHREQARRLSEESLRLSVVRAAAVAAVLGVGLLATETSLLHPVWLTLPTAVFAALVVRHRRVARAEAKARRASRFFDDAVARVDGEWAGRGVAGEQLQPPGHPFAADLDLFGRGSLFELLCTARTSSGEQTLARWLVEPAAPPEIVRRQQAVGELRPRLELRGRVALLGDDVSLSLHPDALAAWADAPRETLGVATRVAALALPVLTATSVVCWLALDWSPAPAVVSATLQAVLATRLRPWCRRAAGDLRRPVRELGLLAELLEVVEGERFTARELTEIQSDLRVDGVPASREVARLRQLEALRDSSTNMLFAPLAVLLMWDLHVAAAIQRWRERCGARLLRWLAGVGRFEALLALAGHAAEHPDDPFPELVAGGPLFAAEGLAHPLIPEARAVANDLVLDGSTAALVVSGSNMSGKSTLLRTVGVNTVLALAGAPVRARRLRLSALSLGASILNRDSLLEGRSRFFAEILRLKQISDLSGGPEPVLFLLDEVLHGTNSHDRRVGAELLLRHLLGRGAVGLVTTHDLALAAIAGEPSLAVRNVHFEDRFEDGRIVFDYRLRPGPVTRSNALELMRQVGLPVDDPEPTSRSSPLDNEDAPT